MSGKYLNPSTSRAVELSYECPAPPLIYDGNFPVPCLDAPCPNPATCNEAPTANAGANQAIESLTGALVGTGFSLCGFPLTYSWEKISGPGNVEFVDSAAASTDFTVDAIGNYVFRLTVSDGFNITPSDTAIAVVPLPSVSMSCESESGSATLIGISEYVSPSTPPKKYRRNAANGTVNFFNNGSGCSIFVGNFTWSGAIQYDRNTGVPIDTRCVSILGGLCNDHGVPAPGDVPDAASFNGWNSAYNANTGCANAELAQTAARTLSTCTGSGLCCDCGAGLHQKAVGTGASALSDEDTETDAIARASSTPGISCTAGIETRGAGDFTFNFVVVAYDILSLNLIAGRTYRVTVDWYEENYGGGGTPSTTTKTYDFVASGTTHHTTDVIVCQYGKQVTAQNATTHVHG